MGRHSRNSNRRNTVSKFIGFVKKHRHVIFGNLLVWVVKEAVKHIRDNWQDWLNLS